MIRLLAHLVPTYLPLAGRHMRIDDVETAAAVGDVPHEPACPRDGAVLVA